MSIKVEPLICNKVPFVSFILGNLVLSAGVAFAQVASPGWDKELQAADSACQAGHYSEAESLYKSAINLCGSAGKIESAARAGKAAKADNPALAKCLISLAALYKEQKKYSQAESLYQRALSLRQKLRHGKVIDVASSMDLLADLYRLENKNVEAETLYKKSIAIYDKEFGSNSFAAVVSLNGLASLYKDQKRYAEAERLYLKMLARTEKKGGPDCPILTPGLNSLATIYSAEGKYDKAETSIKRAIRIEEAELGPDQPHLAVLLENYASILRQDKREQEADKLENRAKDIKEKAATYHWFPPEENGTGKTVSKTVKAEPVNLQR